MKGEGGGNLPNALSVDNVIQPIPDSKHYKQKYSNVITTSSVECLIY